MLIDYYIQFQLVQIHCVCDDTGKGALVLYEEVRGQGGFKEVNRFVWKDGLFDVTWSEANEAILVAASGDGNLLVLDQSAVGQPVPAAVLSGHTAEVYYVLLLLLLPLRLSCSNRMLHRHVRTLKLLFEAKKWCPFN